MNYEFHVGDYVESHNGTVGYISNVKTWYSNVVGGDIVHLEGALTADVSCGFMSFSLDIATCDIHRYFLRIGKYDFTKKEKKKIEPITKPHWDIPVQDLLSKINELVDAVNELMDKEDEE